MDEERLAAKVLSKCDIGNHVGDAWLPERDIQITGGIIPSETKAQKKDTLNSKFNDFGVSSSPPLLSPDTPDGDKKTIKNDPRRANSPTTPLLSSNEGSFISHDGDDVDDARSFRSFLSPLPDPDVLRGRSSQSKYSHCSFSPSMLLRQQSQGLLDTWMRAKWRKEALVADLSMVSSMKIFYYGGSDVCGRPVMVCIGAHAKPDIVSVKEIYYQVCS